AGVSLQAEQLPRPLHVLSRRLWHMPETASLKQTVKLRRKLRTDIVYFPFGDGFLQHLDDCSCVIDGLGQVDCLALADPLEELLQGDAFSHLFWPLALQMHINSLWQLCRQIFDLSSCQTLGQRLERCTCCLFSSATRT